LLNSAAEKLGVPEAKRGKSSVHYNNIKTRKSMMDDSVNHEIFLNKLKYYGIKGLA